MDFFKYSKMFQIESECNKSGEISNKKEVSDFLEKYPFTEGSLLDIGCGSQTTLSEHCKSKQIEYFGLDALFISDKIKGVCLADMHDLPYPNNTFSNVCFFNALEHSISPFIALNEAHRVLKKDGLIFIGLPINTEGHDTSEAHFINLTNSQLKNLLQKVGFKIIAQTEGNMRFTIGVKE